MGRHSYRIVWKAPRTPVLERQPTAEEFSKHPYGIAHKCHNCGKVMTGNPPQITGCKGEE